MKVHVVTKTVYSPDSSDKNVTVLEGVYSSKKKAVSAVDDRLDEAVNALQKYGYKRRDVIVLGIGSWGYDLVGGDGEIRSRYVIETTEVE
jgi:hypothetical protein